MEERNKRSLQIDNVLSSQPELGPSIPDGGYGWFILLGASFFHLLFPSLSISLGIFILFSRLENSAPQEPSLWDNELIYVSLFFMALSSLSEPFARKLARSNKWPRLVTTAGTCLTCAGLLVVWIGINNGNYITILILAGILTGSGTSIILAQIDVLLSQYFNLKLESIKTFLYAVSGLGFIFTPIAIGNNIIKIGLLQVIAWYQAILLQGIIISIVFKKPKYLKAQQRTYKLIRGISDEEEDVFAKNLTELQNPRTSTSKPSSFVPEATSVNVFNPIDNPFSVTDHGLNNWERFEDDTDNHVKTNVTHTSLHKTFALDFNNDLDRIEQVEENYVELPKPLFSESQVNNNTTYSYEASSTEFIDPVVFQPIQSEQKFNYQLILNVFKEPTFYKSLLFIITTRFSIFVFWTLFPTFLYVKIDYLKVHHTTVVVGCIGIGSLIFTGVTSWIKTNPKTRPVFLWMFCWIGTLGYLAISATAKETSIIFGAINITLSINALQILTTPVMKINMRGESNLIYSTLCILTGLAFLFFLCINPSYQKCFQIIALLQFLTGSVWLSNYIYKKIKNKINRSN